MMIEAAGSWESAAFFAVLVYKIPLFIECYFKYLKILGIDVFHWLSLPQSEDKLHFSIKKEQVLFILHSICIIFVLENENMIFIEV